MKPGVSAEVVCGFDRRRLEASRGGDSPDHRERPVLRRPGDAGSNEWPKAKRKSAGGEPPSESYATNLSLDSAASIVAKRLRPLGSPLSLEFSNGLAQAMGQQPPGSRTT